MEDEAAPPIVELRFASLPLFGCAGTLMLACGAGFLYKGIFPATAFLSDSRRYPEFSAAIENATLFGTSPIAIAFAGMFLWLTYQFWWRAIDPVALVAGPRGVGIHPSLWRGMLRWDEIKAITIEPHRQRGITTQRVAIRLRQPHGWRRRMMIFVGPVIDDEAAHRRLRTVAKRHLSAAGATGMARVA